MKAVASIEDELGRLDRALAAAHAEVAAGRLVALDGFAAQLHALCARLERAPRDQAAAHAPRLLELRAALDRLAATIRELIERLAGAADSAGKRNTARAAYGEPPRDRS
jgi:uncharacterized coiled-coil protein SlyX